MFLCYNIFLSQQTITSHLLAMDLSGLKLLEKAKTIDSEYNMLFMCLPDAYVVSTARSTQYSTLKEYYSTFTEILCDFIS